MPVYQMIENQDRLYIHAAVWLVIWSQRWADTNVTLAFEGAQVILPFPMEDTYLGRIWDISDTYLRHV